MSAGKISDCREDSPVHVFDFWNKEYLGAWEKGVSCRSFSGQHARADASAEEDHPQLISTSRHLTQGWVDLVSQTYNAG